MKKQRKQYAPEEKVAILRRHLLEKEPISKLCDEVGLQPTVFYRWQKEFFENGAAAFEQRRPSNHSADQERIAYLEKKIQTKDEVLAAGGRAAAGGGLRGTLQRCPLEQCRWLHHAEGHARRPSAGDPCWSGSEAGGGTKTASDSSAAGGVKKGLISPSSVVADTSKRYAVDR
jgi:transposase